MARVTRTTLARKSLKDIGQYIAGESGSRDIAIRFLDLIEENFFSSSMVPAISQHCTDACSESAKQRMTDVRRAINTNAPTRRPALISLT